MAADRVDAGDGRQVTFTVTAAEGSAAIEAANVSVTFGAVYPGAEPAEPVEADVVVAVGGMSATASVWVSWPASAVSGLWVVHVWVVDGDEVPVESGARWFYVVAANG